MSVNIKEDGKHKTIYKCALCGKFHLGGHKRDNLHVYADVKTKNQLMVVLKLAHSKGLQPRFKDYGDYTQRKPGFRVSLERQNFIWSNGLWFSDFKEKVSLPEFIFHLVGAKTQ